MLQMIAFDADDTLWHNENLFAHTQERFRRLLLPYHDVDQINEKLFETEMRNLNYFGYGVKGFTLSMIETAIELTEGRISGNEISEIIKFAKAMVRAPVECIDGVAETLPVLAKSYPLGLITKGDLFHQEAKLARSGLGDYFRHVEIVSEKDPGIYQAFLDKHGIEPEQFLMVGNSPRSDILPILEIGGYAVHIPYQITWTHEAGGVEEIDSPRYFQLSSIKELPALLEKVSAAAG